MLEEGKLESNLQRSIVYYRHGEDLNLVKKLATEREPVNIAMARYYDQNRLHELFGYAQGAYSAGSRPKLMPNIAIYCHTPIQSVSEEQTEAHVINLIGYAFDSQAQPDYQYFFPLAPPSSKWQELVMRMQQMWRFGFECAQKKRLKRIYLPDVGGGAFSKFLEESEKTKYTLLKQQSLEPLLQDYPDIQVFELPRIPVWLFTDEGKAAVNNSLLVNAWDPWSMVGNGNAADNSLDGYFGRSSAMAILCWPLTNPDIQWESV